MQRHKETFALDQNQVNDFKLKMLNWSGQFSIFLFLDSNHYPSIYEGYECLLAAGQVKWVNDGKLAGGSLDPLHHLQQTHDEHHDWMFGHIGYDFKNILEPKLLTTRQSRTGFPDLHFFIPETVCHINRSCNELTIESFDAPQKIYEAINGTVGRMPKPLPSLSFAQGISKPAYAETILKLKEHIRNGDCYEINFCSEGFCEGAVIEPLAAFHALNALSPAPFAAYYRLLHRYVICASPERYLRKLGDRLLSQPIKGTARRDGDAVKDAEIKSALYNDIKERAENVMIVDLVRNDLARCCIPGSVLVDELFGIYSFPQVHQMVSTVSGLLRPDCRFTDALRSSFPMGSMTGAPKFKVMQLIDHYEKTARGLYSGTVGYISPDGNFDFNVVIRSLFYDAESRYASYQTGGAITYDSDPEREWNEMRLKAWAMERIFR